MRRAGLGRTLGEGDVRCLPAELEDAAGIPVVGLDGRDVVERVGGHLPEPEPLGELERLLGQPDRRVELDRSLRKRPALLSTTAFDSSSCIFGNSSAPRSRWAGRRCVSAEQRQQRQSSLGLRFRRRLAALADAVAEGFDPGLAQHLVASLLGDRKCPPVGEEEAGAVPHVLRARARAQP